MVGICDSQRNTIFGKIEGQFYKLSFCQFGNYLMQHLAEKGSDKYKEILCNMIVVNILDMSFDKYASNVIERGINHWNLDFIERVFEELKKPNQSSPHL